MTLQYPRPTPQGAWFVHWIDSDDEHQLMHADGLEGSAPRETYGESVDLSLKLYTPTKHREDPPPITDHRRRYRNLRDIGYWTGEYSLFPAIAQAPLFQDSTPATAPSPLMGFEPSYDTAATSGFWALLDGYSDDTTLEDSLIEINLSLTYFARFEDYGPGELDQLLEDRSYTGLTI